MRQAIVLSKSQFYRIYYSLGTVEITPSPDSVFLQKGAIVTNEVSTLKQH